MSLSNLPASERPRERLLRMGSASLSLQELLAVLLRTGRKGSDVMSLAANLLRDYPDERALARVTPAELCSFPGLGEAKAAALLAAIELGHRLNGDPKKNGGPAWQGILLTLEKRMTPEEREFILPFLRIGKAMSWVRRKFPLEGLTVLSSMLHIFAEGRFAWGLQGWS
jgi:DNA repair protein RadC